MGVQSISLVSAQSPGRKLNFSKDQIDVMRYGFEVIIGTALKIAILLSLAHILNLFLYMLVILITSGIYRLLSGGVHCTSYTRCLIFGIVLYFSLALLAKSLPVLSNPLLLMLLLLLTIFSLLVSLKYAPAETESKPISQPEIYRLKKLTIIWICCWFITLVCTLFGPPRSTGSLILTTMLAHLTQTMSLTPTGYRVVGFFDDIMSRFF